MNGRDKVYAVEKCKRRSKKKGDIEKLHRYVCETKSVLITFSSIFFNSK